MTRQQNTEATQSAEANDDICRSTAGEFTADSESPALIYDPWAVKRGHQIEIWGRQQNPDIIPWGFWGGVLSAVVAVMILFRGSTGQISLLDVLWVSVALIVGLGLFKLGRRSSLEERLLCEIDRRHSILSWPSSDSSGPVAVAFDDVEELTFSKVRVPVENSRANTHLDAATVWVRDDRGRTISIISASTSKAETHAMARLLSKLLGVSVNYEGTGVREWV